MKSIESIKKQIAGIEADDLYQRGKEKPATIDINAPLALVQLILETQLKTLKWVLDDN